MIAPVVVRNQSVLPWVVPSTTYTPAPLSTSAVAWSAWVTLASAAGWSPFQVGEAPGLAWPLWVALALVPADACLAGLVSADWIEHYLKKKIFGYNYNPNVMARGEFEGSNTIMDPIHEAVWREKMFSQLAIGDDPGGGHYDYPLPWRWRWLFLP